MAGLALIVSLIFISLIIIGPASYFLSLVNCIPQFIKYLLSLLCIAVGLWALFVPVPLFRILGLINFSIGLKIAFARKEKTTQA